jgi:hypothetical protein
MRHACIQYLFKVEFDYESNRCRQLFGIINHMDLLNCFCFFSSSIFCDMQLCNASWLTITMTYCKYNEAYIGGVYMYINFSVHFVFLFIRIIRILFLGA